MKHKFPHEPRDGRPRPADWTRVPDQGIGGGPFARCRKLMPFAAAELRRGPASLAAHPRFARPAGGIHVNDPIAPSRNPRLQKQRGVQHDEPRPDTAERGAYRAAHQGMQDPVQPAELFRIPEHDGGEGGGVDSTVSSKNRTTPGRADLRPDRPPDQQAFDDRVGVDHGGAMAGEQRSHEGFAAPDSADEADDGRSPRLPPFHGPTRPRTQPQARIAVEASARDSSKRPIVR